VAEPHVLTSLEIRSEREQIPQTIETKHILVGHREQLEPVTVLRNQQVAGSIPAGGSINSTTYSALDSSGFATVWQNSGRKPACGETPSVRKPLQTLDQRSRIVRDLLTDCQRPFEGAADVQPQAIFACAAALSSVRSLANYTCTR
jgi:hypothetical protein